MDNDKLRKLAEAATPGPWAVKMGDIVQLTDAGKGYPLDMYPDSADIASRCDCGNGGRIADNNSAFIAAASPDRVIALLDEIERLQFHSQQYVKSLNMLQGFSEADPHDAIHELIEENAGLHQQLAAANAEIAAMTRELERWRHGVTIEGDFVCPDSLELTETKQQLSAMTDARDEACYRWAQLRHDSGLEPDSHVEKLRKVGAP